MIGHDAFPALELNSTSSINKDQAIFYAQLQVGFDEEKLSEGLQKLAEEDPTFRVKYDQETGQTIMSGMGELHLEILVVEI